MSSGGVSPGWYEDPAGEAELRWWDGTAWTAQVRHTSGGRRGQDPPSDAAGPARGEASGRRSSRRAVPLVAIVGLVLVAAVVGGAIGVWVVADGWPGGEQAAPEAETYSRPADGVGEADGSSRADIERLDDTASRWVSNLNGNVVHAVVPAQDGGVWTGGAGVRHWGSDGILTQVHHSEHGLAGNMVLAVAVAVDGTVWAGTGDGVSRFDGQGWTSFALDDGLAGHVVSSVAVAPDGTVWAGTGGGLSRFDPSVDS